MQGNFGRYWQCLWKKAHTCEFDESEGRTVCVDKEDELIAVGGPQYGLYTRDEKGPLCMAFFYVLDRAKFQAQELAKAGHAGSEGLLAEEHADRQVLLRLKLLSLSRNALQNLDLRQEAGTFLRSLIQSTGLSVHMAVLDRKKAVIIEQVEAPGLLKFATWIGRRLDVNCTGIGKALTAFLSEDEFKAERPLPNVVARSGASQLLLEAQ
jgi:hypothetical protein